MIFGEHAHQVAAAIRKFVVEIDEVCPSQAYGLKRSQADRRLGRRLIRPTREWKAVTRIAERALVVLIMVMLGMTALALAGHR